MKVLQVGGKAASVFCAVSLSSSALAQVTWNDRKLYGDYERWTLLHAAQKGVKNVNGLTLVKTVNSPITGLSYRIYVDERTNQAKMVFLGSNTAITDSPVDTIQDWAATNIPKSLGFPTVQTNLAAPRAVRNEMRNFNITECLGFSLGGLNSKIGCATQGIPTYTLNSAGGNISDWSSTPDSLVTSVRSKEDWVSSDFLGMQTTYQRVYETSVSGVNPIAAHDIQTLLNNYKDKVKMIERAALTTGESPLAGSPADNLYSGPIKFLSNEKFDPSKKVETQAPGAGAVLKMAPIPKSGGLLDSDSEAELTRQYKDALCRIDALRPKVGMPSDEPAINAVEKEVELIIDRMKENSLDPGMISFDPSECTSSVVGKWAIADVSYVIDGKKRTESFDVECSKPDYEVDDEWVKEYTLVQGFPVKYRNTGLNLYKSDRSYNEAAAILASRDGFPYRGSPETEYQYLEFADVSAQKASLRVCLVVRDENGKWIKTFACTDVVYRLQRCE